MMTFTAFFATFLNTLRRGGSAPWYKKVAVLLFALLFAIILFLIAVDCNFCYLFGRSPGFDDIKNPVVSEASEVYTCDKVLM